MNGNGSRIGLLVGLTAAAGAFGAAAMISTATARADDFTDTIATAETELADGQAAFTVAETDFDSNLLTAGTAALFSGVDDDVLSAPNTLLAGTVEGLTNETYDLGTQFFGLGVPGTFTDALSFAESAFEGGLSFFSDGATALSAGDYGDAVSDDLFGMDLVSIVPLQEILLGTLASF